MRGASNLEQISDLSSSKIMLSVDNSNNHHYYNKKGKNNNKNNNNNNNNIKILTKPEKNFIKKSIDEVMSSKAMALVKTNNKFKDTQCKYHCRHLMQTSSNYKAIHVKDTADNSINLLTTPTPTPTSTPTHHINPQRSTIRKSSPVTTSSLSLTTTCAYDKVIVSSKETAIIATTTKTQTFVVVSTLLSTIAKQCHIPPILSLLSSAIKISAAGGVGLGEATGAGAGTGAIVKTSTTPKTTTTKYATVKSGITCSLTKTKAAVTAATTTTLTKGYLSHTIREFAWLLPLVTLVTLFGCGQAGFACLSNPCIFGVCIDGLNSSYSCYCIDGYTGIQCQTNWDECWSGPCQNGGTCIDGVAYYNCTCPDGFSGIDCEENVDECMSNPCQNGGHCRDRNNGYTCTCQPGYLGDHCETDVAVCETGTGARCHNGGACMEGPGLEFFCECAPGWHGRICQDEINECDSAPCQNGGVCVDKLANYVCACPMGYTGTNCEEEILICADNPCENNALCLMEEGIPTCYCVPDYHGEKCEYQYDECQLGPRCMNGGVCIDGVDTFSCSCPPLLTGMLCECLMIGEDSLDCNYTAPSTMMAPTFSSMKPLTTRHTYIPSITPSMAEATPKGEQEDHEREYKYVDRVEGGSLEKPSPATKITYTVSPKHWGDEDISASYTTETSPGSYQTGLGDSSEETVYSEVSASEEQSTSEEFTTMSRFDGSLSSEEMTTARPILWPHDFDYNATTKFTDTTSTESKDIHQAGDTKTGVSFSAIPPTKPIILTTATNTGYDKLDYTTKRTTWSDGELPAPTFHSTIDMPYITSKAESDGQFSTMSHTSKSDIWNGDGVVTPKYIPKPPPTLLPTTIASFFTELPEVVITTKYYDFNYKDKEKDYGSTGSVTYRPHIPTYSVTTIGSAYDHEGPVFSTSSPGISITVYSPENRTYSYHRPTPTPYYPPPIKTTMKTKVYHETTTPHYIHIPTTPMLPYHPQFTSVGSLPTYRIDTEDFKTQRIPPAPTTTTGSIYRTEYGVSIKPTYPEIANEYKTSITFRPTATYKPTLKPTTSPPTKSPIHTTVPTVPTVSTVFKPAPATTLKAEKPTEAQEPTLLTQSTIPATITTQSTITLTTQATQLPQATWPPDQRQTQPTLPTQTTEPTQPIYETQSTLSHQATFPPPPSSPVTLPAHPTLLPQPTKQPQSTTTPSPTRYSPSITHPTSKTSTISDELSEEEDSANTVSPEIIGIDVQPPLVGPSPDIVTTGTDMETTADCVTMGCYNGGTCVTTSEGSRCVCRFDRQGALCEQPIIIKNAAFSGDSYVSHRIHKDIAHHATLDTVLPMHVQLKVRTRATNGLIMLAAAQGTKGGHYMALFLQKGLLQFQFSCGLQTMLLSELETPVNTGHEIIIRAELDFSRNYTHCNASLLVNDTLAMSGDQPTWLKLLPSRMHTPESILNTWLHLGGAPQAPIGLIIELPPSQSGSGFTGCLHSLRINEETREIFGEALDGFGITECGSLACLSSPCRNGAACIKIETNEMDENGDKVEKWKCKCPTGYMGPTCEISVCEDNPCQYGGTCVQFPGSGYLCLCPLGKHGHYCEHNLEAALPSFSGSVNGLSSFVAYTVPIPLEYSMELSFKILPQTMSQIALLAFLGQMGYHDEKSDHLAVSFIQGYIMLTWNLGAGPRRIFTQKAIDFRLDAPRIPYEIRVGRIGRQAWLSVDGKFNITGRSPGSVSRMDVMPILYLGGHEIANFHTLPHDLPLHSGFQGCIYDVHLKAGQVTVPLQETRGVRGRGVGQCGTRECHRHACQHDGACLQHGATFTCICQEGWYGPLCAQPTNPCDSFNNKCSDEATCVPLVNGYECDCPVGKTGKNCEEVIHSLSDVSLTGRRSYLAVRWPYFYDSIDKLGSKRSQMISYRNYTKKLMPPKSISSTNQHFVMKLLNEVEKQRNFSPVPLKSYNEQHRRVQFFFIEFQLRPLSERGLLLYFGTLNSNQDKKVGFVSLSLQGGVVEFRISGPNSHVTVVRSVRMLAIGEWHKIKMAQRGRWLTLWVEGSASSALAPTAEVLVEPDSLLYIGGLKDLSKLPHNAISGFPIAFRGCVRGLVVSGTRIVLNETNIVESRNIRDCDGTACGGDSCEAGGHCWLDEKLQPHCICPEYAKGDRCEYSETCKLIPCKNNGRCLRSGRCSCPNGWGGFYCEIALGKPITPSFRGNSYLVLPPPRIPMKDKRKGPSIYLRPREAIQVSLNFSTIEPNGLLLWSEQDTTKFLGLGLENGHLKLASNLLGSINDTVSTPSSGFITDGSWHSAKIIVDRGRLELQLDGDVVFSEKLALIENLLTSSTTTPAYRSRSRSSRKGKELSVTYENVFYLGGFPNLESVAKRTQGRFTVPFKGCLQDIQFGIEANALIKDFSTYQGENIGSCDLHGDEPIVMV